MSATDRPDPSATTTTLRRLARDLSAPATARETPQGRATLAESRRMAAGALRRLSVALQPTHRNDAVQARLHAGLCEDGVVTAETLTRWADAWEAWEA